VRNTILGIAAVIAAILLGAAGAWRWSHRGEPIRPPSAEEVPRQRHPAAPERGTPHLQAIVPPAATPPEGAPYVLFVTMDTTRSDHLGLYGYFRNTSPTLDALGRESTVFDRYTVPMSITLPSHMTVFTGTFPDEHGVTANMAHGGKKFVPSPMLESFAQYMSSVGYVTGAVVSSSPLKKYTGINNGFQTYYEPEGEARHARDTTDLAVEWVQAAPDRPFFLWVHYFDPHWPYNPPGRWSELFHGDQTATQAKWLEARQAVPADVGLEKVSAKLDKYDGEIAYMDQNIGRLFDALKAKGIWDNLVIVAIGDHGEGLMQHDYPSHGHVWTEQINPPFILKLPGQAPRRVHTPVSGVDVTATLLGQIELPSEDRYLAQVSGHDVLAADYQQRPLFFRTSEIQHDKATDTKFAKPITWGVSTADWIYHWTEGGEVDLFDRANDPYELHDVSSQHADVVAEMNSELEKDRAQQAERGKALGSGQTADLPAEDLAALKALGYVDGEPDQQAGGDDEVYPANKKAPRTP
jgi:arylsulfatase A-like enzyme